MDYTARKFYELFGAYYAAPVLEFYPKCWVTRWVSEPPEQEFPVMSRERYREVLRHLWLRGVAGMQVFSPRYKGYEDMAVPDVADAVAAYDDMLAFREF